MDRLGSSRAVIYEGPNSLIIGNRKVKLVLKRLVEGFHRFNKKVYIAEMPTGVSGSGSYLDWYSVSRYNQDIRDVGADGIIPTSDVPWQPGRLHGYTEETFPYLLSRFHTSVNRGCGYSRFPPEHHLRKSYERARRQSLKLARNRSHRARKR
jgi:hypothetical protein